MSDKAGWGIVGTGGQARDIMIPALMASPTSFVAGACGSDPDRAKKQLEQWPDIKIYSKFEEMLDDPAIDIIYIATPHFLHVPQAVQAIDAGKHVFTEPPMSLSVDGAHKLVEKARNQGVKFGVAFQYRFHSAVKDFREKIQNNEIGEIKHITVSLSEPVKEYSGWWTDTFRTGPASLLRIGVHALDLLWILKGAPVTEVAAMGLEEGESKINIAIDSIFRFDDNSLGAIHSSTCLYEQRHLAIAEGSTGRLEIRGDFRGDDIVALREYVDGEISDSEYEPEDPVGHMIDAFVEAINSDSDYHPDGTDGKEAVKITCAVIDSVKACRMARVSDTVRSP